MFQKWFRSQCKRRVINCSVLLLLLNDFALAVERVPALLQEVEKKYTQSQTLSATFVQMSDSAALAKKKQSSGKLFFKRPSRVRWETVQPDVSLFVSNGQKSWFYTPPFVEGENGQVLEGKSISHSQLADALLAGSFSVLKEMQIQQQSPTVFILKPDLKKSGGILQAKVEIDLTTKVICKVMLDHLGGNHTEITLSKIELGGVLGDTLFHFKVPPHTDHLE